MKKILTRGINEGQYGLIVRSILLVILIISSILLFHLYFFKSYIAEEQIANALPLAIVVGLSSIAIAIYERN